MHTGRVVLERNDGMVHARLRVPLADVMNSQLQAPAYQVQVPEAFRPGYAIEQSTYGNPIGLNAHTALDVNATVDVQVEPEGNLSFSVRSEGSAGNAAGLWWEARLVWPMHATQPRVCQRSPEVQRGIQLRLKRTWEVSVSCEQVTWAHLASIQALDNMEVVSIQDVHGLTGLQEAELNLSPELQIMAVGDVLAHMPGLTRLRLRVPHPGTWPVDALASTPRLTSLELSADNLTALSPAWLARVPHLTALSLYAPRLANWPVDRLAPVPRLRQLALHVGTMELWSADWLSSAANLEDLTLAVWPQSINRPTSYPEQFLAHAPRLTHLKFFSDQETLPPGFLSHTPRLTHVEAQLLNLTALPDDFLAYTPQLTHVSLLTPQLTALPPRFLGQAPQLEELELKHLGAGTPPSVALASLPEGFLAHTPRLTRLELYPSRVTTLPEGFLAHTPRLNEAVLLLPEASALPAGFLSHTPRLQHLTLEANRSAALPEGFLAQAPDLRYLHLRLFGLGPAIPPDFLQHVPTLARLYLWAEKLTTLPAHFLQDVPHLRKLHLWLPQLDPPPAPGEVLWRLLQEHSEWRRAAGDDTPLYGQPDARDDQVVLTVPAGTRLRVVERIRDGDGQEWLKVRPNYGYLNEADLLHMLESPAWIPSSLTEPSVQDRCVGEYLCYYPGGPVG
ncbi:MAG: hypothetical protein OXH72_16170 [Caldilineaceae bacterium]|nr:hypothetical protein [Caldilineaceae bacterium]